MYDLALRLKTSVFFSPILLLTDCLNIGKDRVIQEFYNWGLSFKIEFDITVNKLGSGYSNVLHFTANGNNDDLGDRIPGIWMHSDSFFYIENDFCTIFENGCGTQKTFALNTKYNITIQQYSCYTASILEF